MPVPTIIKIEVLVVVNAGAGLLVFDEPTASPDTPSHALPGTAVGDGESVSAALARIRETLPVPVDGAAEFVGCVEHGGPGSLEPHTLTLLYSVAMAGTPEAKPATGHVVIAPDALATLPGVPAGLAAAVRRWWADDWPVWQGLPVHAPEPWWGGLRVSVRTIRAQLAARRAELADAEFRDAAVAMCVLVAAADGSVDEVERQAMVSAMAADDVLSQFDPADLSRHFDGHVAQLRGEDGPGRRALLREIAKVRGRPTYARAVVRLGAVIGRADGVFDPDERAAVAVAARLLDVEPWVLAIQSGASDPPGDDTGERRPEDEDTGDRKYQP